LLIELASDSDLRVAGAAIEALGRHPTLESRQTLWRVLDMQDGDNGLKLAAVLALAEMPAAEDLPHLERAFREARGDIATELRFNVLRGAAKVAPLGGGSEVRSLLALGFADPHPFVRRVAAQEWAAIAPSELPPTPPPGGVTEEPLLPLSVGTAPADAPSTWASIETSRGTMVFELFPSEAPVHVHNFAWLARGDHYDGLSFHRVVPNFVIQGGDYRGDGNGGVTWNGHPLPCEIGRRPFVRGSLGMPRNEDWDSGGSQIFVTHRPTPHLDGRYTIFGELREGFEVLDAIEVDDLILDVRVHDGPPK
jgi:cyclophilin family peptidyl-prolyl cis-trans isomerase